MPHSYVAETEAPLKRRSLHPVGPDLPQPSAHSSLLDLAGRVGNSGLQDLMRRSIGHSLPPQLHARAERTFGEPLQGVRIHDDGASSLAASLLGARSFAVDNHIFLGGGPAADHLEQSDESLGHEIAHLLQHRGSRGVSTEPAESAARQAGTAFVEGRRARVGSTSSAPALQCDKLPSEEARHLEETLKSLGEESLSVGEVAAPLRELYNESYAAIRAKAEAMLREGASTEEAARYLVNARNELKLVVRARGPASWASWAAFRNRYLKGYKTTVGPSYEELFARMAKKGVPEGEIAARILAKPTSRAYNLLPKRAFGLGGLLALPVAALEAYSGYREGLGPGQIGLRTAGTLGNFFAFPGMYGAKAPAFGMKPGTWGGGAADMLVNLINLGAQLGGAPKGVTDVTQTAADITPSSTMASGTRSAVDFVYAGVTEGSIGLERVHQQQLTGGGGGMIQGYAMIGGLLGGEDLSFLTSEAAAEGQYGPLVEAGDFWGDVLTGDESLSRDFQEFWEWL